MNLALKVSLIGPHTAEHTVTKNVVTNIQTSLSMLTPKYFAENINVTTDIDIRKIRKTKRIEVTRFMLEVLFTIIYFNLCRNSFPISNHPIVIKTVRNININTYIFISMPDGNNGTTAGSTTANTGFSS